MGWADKRPPLKVRANAETPPMPHRAQVRRGRHRPLPHRAHVLRAEPHHRRARDDPAPRRGRRRKAALAKLLPMQRADFIELFEIMDGLPVTIRLLDPPLHEFLPHTEEGYRGSGEGRGIERRDACARARNELHEFNPMLGHRGCRLASPTRKSTRCRRARFRGACDAGKTSGKRRSPEIMIPLVMTKARAGADQKWSIDREGRVRRKGVKIPIMVGTMIELPRAALRRARSPRRRSSSASAPTT
jgi:pyruvate,orthophosphate dikinase